MMSANFVLGVLPCQFGDTRQQRTQPTLSANILFMFQAIVTSLHSPRTLSSPRSRRPG